jgi:phosphoribosylformimino-5-aminoimidazole carboxamide ribotide isomerase
MDIVPVIDLMGGVAVHARLGRRAAYAPLRSACCASSDPMDVMAGLLALHPFKTFYFADLDALTGKAGQREQLLALHQAYPETAFWVDAGWPVAPSPWTAVVGTESLDSDAWNVLKRRSEDWILSLDFFEDGYRGPAEILAQAEFWPERAIMMSLNRVGGAQGPDFERLQSVMGLAAGRRCIAAGGVRHEADLEGLARLGVEAALTASALHEGKLKAWLEGSWTSESGQKEKSAG